MFAAPSRRRQCGERVARNAINPTFTRGAWIGDVVDRWWLRPATSRLRHHHLVESRLIVETLKVPASVDVIQVEQGQPIAAGHLEVVAGNGPAPPALIDAPSIADFDSLAPAIPAKGHQLAVEVQLDIYLRVFAQQPRHGDVLRRDRAAVRSPLGARPEPEAEPAGAEPAAAKPGFDAESSFGAEPEGAEPATGRHFQRASANTASESSISIQPTRSSPNRRASLTSCQPSRPVRPVCGVKSESCVPAAGATSPSSRSTRDTGACGGAISRRAISRRSIASPSEVGSGRSWTISISGGIPPTENERSSSRVSRARAAAAPRATS